MTRRVAGQFRGRTQAGLGHDIVLVELDRSRRNVEDRANLLDDLALRQELQNLPFAARQSDGVFGAVGGVAHQVLQHLVFNSRSDISATGEGLADRHNQLIGCRMLQHIAGSSQAEGLRCQRDVGAGGQKNETCAEMRALALAERIEAVQQRHGNIGYGSVGLESLNFIDHFPAVPGRGHDLEFRLEYAAESIEDDLVIVGKYDSVSHSCITLW